MKTKSRNHAGAEDIMNDLRVLASDARSIFADSVQEPAAEAIAALRARIDAAQERLNEYYETAKEKTVEGARATDKVIRAKPYQAVAVALGAGLLIGLFLGRKKD
jgi:ElaB/YqjD/DUF883 family membrane-anchored ribosome-binding protein